MVRGAKDKLLSIKVKTGKCQLPIVKWWGGASLGRLYFMYNLCFGIWLIEK